ncbi:MAG: hypothetical protein IPJ82_21825 [Lewinellaceae bacterium]|nr:hypothetical protein [Lewinellaceae bacterium]
MHAHFGDLEAAHFLRDALVGDVAFETEPEDDEPVGIAAGAAFFHGFVDALFGHGAELRPDVQVSLALARGAVVEAFGV